MGQAGWRPIIAKFDGPGRAAAHEMWALYGPLRPAHEVAHRPVWAAIHEMWCITANTASTSTTSILPMRRSTCFHGPARAVAHAMWCPAILCYYILLRVVLQYHYYDVRAAHEAAHGLHAPRHGTARV